MTHPAWRKHLRDSLCIFSHTIALPRRAEVRYIFLSPDMTSARCTYVISTTCLTLVSCLKPTLEQAARQKTATPFCALYPNHSGDPAPTLASGARFALVAEGREPKGASLSSYHKLLGHRHIILVKSRRQIQEVGCRLKLAVSNKMKQLIL